MNTVVADGGGLRYNKGKAPIHLIPPEGLFALAEHYGRGAEKYKERNWEKGMKWSHCYNSMMRHSLSWMQGEDKDPETGTHHMIAAAWNALALFVYYVRGIGEDDRPIIMPKDGLKPGSITLLTEQEHKLLLAQQGKGNYNG